MRDRLLILCFHGFEINDEAAFRPKLFMRQALFKKRLETIGNFDFPVLELPAALERLKNGSLPDNAVCITIDDGFYSVLSLAVPLLR